MTAVVFIVDFYDVLKRIDFAGDGIQRHTICRDASFAVGSHWARPDDMTLSATSSLVLFIAL